MLAKFNRLVATIGVRIYLEITTSKPSYQVIGRMAVIQIVTDNALCIVGLVSAPGWRHERINKALKTLIVLVDVHNLVSAIVPHSDMDMKAASLVHLCAGGIQHLAAGLEALETIRIVFENGSHTLNRTEPMHRTIGDELIIRPIVGMVISFVSEIKVRTGVVFDKMPIDIALNLNTESKALTVEESGELQPFYITRAKADLDAHLLLLGESHIAFLNLIQGFFQGFHNT